MRTLQSCRMRDGNPLPPKQGCVGRVLVHIIATGGGGAVEEEEGEETQEEGSHDGR